MPETPRTARRRRERMPLFPLPGFFLFPGTLVPLHVFEPRYRRMVEHLLDTRGRLAFSSVRREYRDELDGNPPILDVGGVGEIVRHRRLDDGRFMLLVAGLGRARLEEIPSAEPYRRVRVEWLSDADVATDPTPLKAALLLAIAERTRDEAELDVDAPLGQVADFLLAHLKVDERDMETAYADLDPVSRAETALAWHGEA